MIDVVALGELLIDFTCVATDEENYPTMAAHPGGAPANFLTALSKFGAKTALLGKVGNDAFGRLLLRTLQNAQIDTTGIICSEDVFTTLAFVTLDSHGERAFSFARKPGADTCLRFDELKLDLIDRARVLHFGSLSLTDEPARSATYRAVEYAKARGKLISYDPNLRLPLWRSLEECKTQMLWGLSQSDVVKISDEEVKFLFGMGAEEGAAHILRNYGAKLVFVTCGADGCYFRNAAAAGWVPALSGICPVDTTGAGDIFGGSALWKLLALGQPAQSLNEQQLREVADFGCTAAGLSVTKPGGISSAPAYEEVLRQLAGEES